MTTRERILRAALKVYNENGQSGFSMRSVAGRAELTPTAIYRHFDDKRDLVRAITDRARDRLLSRLLDATEGETSLERLHRCGDGYLRFARETPHLYRLLFVDPLEEDLPRFPQDASGERTAPFMLIVQRVRECMEEGSLLRDDPLSITLTVWSLVHGLCMLWLSGRVEVTQLRAIYDVSLDRLLDGLKS